MLQGRAKSAIVEMHSNDLLSCLQSSLTPLVNGAVNK